MGDQPLEWLELAGDVFRSAPDPFDFRVPGPAWPHDVHPAWIIEPTPECCKQIYRWCLESWITSQQACYGNVK
jgi:hypothetical protein